MSLDNWKTVKLEEIKAPKKYSLVGGPFGSNLVTRDYVEQGVPVIRGTNLSGDYRFSLEDLVYVSEEKANDLLSNNAHPGDVVFTQRGTLGQIGIIPKDCGYERFVISQSQMKLTVDETQAEPLYIYYFFKSAGTVQKIHNLAISSGVPHINLQILREFDIPLPPLSIQRCIADILSAYDDLIENNTHRIRILEGMAQAIYAETVHAPSVRGRSLPKGWKLVKLSEVADVNSTNIRNGNEPEEINYVDIASVSTGKIDTIQSMKFSDAPGRARRIVKHGDVIWSTVRPNRKSYSLIIHPPENMIVSTGFAVLRAKTVPFSYLYLATTTDDFAGYLTNHATGSAYPAVNSSDFENAEVVLPPKELLNKFDSIVSPMFILRETLLAKNTNLRQTRDLLLPRLVSGEIVVPS